MGIQVTERYRGCRENMPIPAGGCDWNSGIVDDSHQMSCPMTTVVIVMQIAVGLMMGVTGHQIKCRCIMPYHCVGMGIPRKGQPGTEVGQQQQVDQ